MPVLEPVYVILSLGVMTIFLVMAAFMLLMMFRAWRAPRIYYPPKPRARELVKELMCPRCGLKELEPTGFYTIRCRSCAFMFSVGVVQAYHIIPAGGSGPYSDGGPSFGYGRSYGLKENEHSCRL